MRLEPQEKPKRNIGHKDTLIVDGHVDLTHFMMKQGRDLKLSALEEGPFTLKKIREGGVRLFANALYCEDRYNGEKSIKRLEQILKFTTAHFDEVTLIRNKADLEGLEKGPGSPGTLLLLENADALAGDFSYIDKLMEWGIRIVGLTHVGKNRLADGNNILYSEGLTKEGKEIVRALKEQGILIDIAHLHPKCFWELLKLTESPVVSSHTGVRAVCDTQRNLGLDQIKEVIARGGLVGVTFNPEMLSPDGKATIGHIFIHLDVMVQKFGPDGVAIGSDFCGFEGAAKGLEEITKIPQLIDHMVKHGYDEDAVEKIMGLNWLKIYKRIL
ncbi:MAG: membrane dipeptidase [Pseudomonadota bacterium]